MNVNKIKMRKLCENLGYIVPKKNVQYQFNKKYDIYKIIWNYNECEFYCVELLKSITRYKINIYCNEDKKTIYANSDMLDMFENIDIITKAEKENVKKITDNISKIFLKNIADF